MDPANKMGLTLFNDESMFYQDLLWCKNGKNAAALAVARINLMKTGKDQLKCVMGIIHSKVSSKP